MYPADGGDRSLEKTPEQLFINSLRKEYELSPAESLGILELAKSCLFGEMPKGIRETEISLRIKKGKAWKSLKRAGDERSRTNTGWRCRRS